MFIESITLSGILNIQDVKKQEFSFDGSKFVENEDEHINTIHEEEFIYGFSLIFDPVFDEEFNYKEFITGNSKQEPFVEIKLWQRDSNLESIYSWLHKEELILKRNLKRPGVLLVNNKTIKIKEFHEAIANLGFIGIEGLHIHRLLDAEVNKLGFLLGEDLWNMLMKIIACEELIHMAEHKQGIIKKRLMKRTFENLTEKVEQILPKKMKFQKDINTQFNMRGDLFAMLGIIQQRQNVLLNFQIESLDEKIVPLFVKIKRNYFEQHRKEKTIGSYYQQRENTRNMRIQVEGSQNMIDYAISRNSHQTQPSPYLESFTNILQEVNESSQLQFDIDTDKSYELTGWKLLLKESESEEDLMSLSNILEVSGYVQSIVGDYHKEYDESIEDFEQDIESFSENSFVKQLEKLAENEKALITVSLKTEEDIIKERSNIANILEELTEAAYDAQIPMKFKADLITINDLVKEDEELKRDYIGPLFRFLDPAKCPELSCKMWPQLMSAAHLILFKTAASASKIGHYFFQVRANVSYTAIGIDEYLKNVNDEFDSYDFSKAEELIKTTIDPSVRDAIKNILSFFLKTENEEYRPSDDLKACNITCYNQYCSIVYDECSTAVINQLPNCIWQHLKMNPIEASQYFYSLIEKRGKIVDKIKVSENLRENLLAEFGKREHSFQKQISEQKANKVYNSILHSMLISRKSHFNDNRKLLESFEKIKNNFASDVGDWSEENLRKQLENLEILTQSNVLHKEEELASPLKIYHAFLAIPQPGILQLFEDVSEAYYNLKQKVLKEKLKTFHKFHSHLNLTINEMYETEIRTLENNYLNILGENQSMQTTDLRCQMGHQYAQKCLIETIMKSIEASIEKGKQGIVRPKTELVNLYQNKSNEEVIKMAAEYYEKLYEEKNTKVLHLTNLTSESYVKLKQSFVKLGQYLNHEVFQPVEVKKRAYPLMNFLVVKMLRDTVHHYKVSYNVIFSEYLALSSLFFYTHGEINEAVEEDKFNWNCFDMTRLKSIDFVDKWEAGYETKIRLEKIKQIKAFLLILHMINYISIFKFSIISARIFKGLTPELESKVRGFLKTISSHVQVIIIENVQPMDVSE